jgi:hypothetical protein
MPGVNRLLFIPLLLSLCVSGTAVHAQQAPVSEFTTTDPKKVKILEDSTLEKNPGIDHFRHLCPGLGGYQVIHEGSDLRSWINLKINGKATDLRSATLTRIPGQFPSKANDVVQWRGFRRGGTFQPFAIIYRMRSSTDEEKPKPIDTFVIIKLDKENPKVVAHVPGKDGNEKAEQVADKLCQP